MAWEGIIQGGIVKSPFQNQLWEDLSLEHEKVIWGATFHALREITGKDMAAQEMEKEVNEHLGLDFPDHRRFFEIVWKGEPILRVHQVGIMTFRTGKIIRHRRIEQLWRKRWNVLKH